MAVRQSEFMRRLDAFKCGGFFEVKIIVNIKMWPDLMFTRPCGD
jgi:hypothetical protein